MPKISVIMPSLNVAKYIQTCMESVLNQTFQDIEVLAVDAGSTDGTLEILQDYAQKDARVRLIHSEVRSYGYQVNLGISQSKGDYIGIVETDDILVQNAYELLYKKAVDYDADFAKGHARLFWKVSEDMEWGFEIPIYRTENPNCDYVFVPRDYSEILIKDTFVWLGIYKRDFLKDIHLNETPGAAFQDQGFLLQTFTKANKAVYIDKVVYNYRQDNTGSSIYNTKGFFYLLQEYGLNKTYAMGLSPDWIQMYYTRLFNQCMARFEVMAFSGKFWKEASVEIDELRKTIRIAIHENKFKTLMLSKDRKQMLEMFLESTNGGYNYYVQQTDELCKHYRNLMLSVANRNVVIFGAGRVGKFLHMLLESRNCNNVVCYCDNNKTIQNTMLQGKKVLTPERAFASYPQALFMLAGRRFEREMREQLTAIGVDMVDVYTYTMGIEQRLFRIK